MTKVVSFRVKPEELAKALEGLINTHSKPENLTTISNIVRTTFYHGIIALCKEPGHPASIENQQKIDQLFSQNKRSTNLGIESILNEE